jgi:hypothetical protein
MTETSVTPCNTCARSSICPAFRIMSQWSSGTFKMLARLQGSGVRMNVVTMLVGEDGMVSQAKLECDEYQEFSAPRRTECKNPCFGCRKRDRMIEELRGQVAALLEARDARPEDTVL